MSDQIVLVNETQSQAVTIKLLHDGGKQRVKALSNYAAEIIWHKSIQMWSARADRVTRNSDHWSDEA
jgi:hypothetical protein